MTKWSKNAKALTTLALAAFPGGVFAAVAEGLCRSSSGGYCVNLAAAIPGLEFLGEATDLGDLIARLYIWGLGFVGVSAMLVFIYGGVKYMVAGDKDPSEAKKAMTNAVIGLVIALLSWLILFTINPDLIKKFHRRLDPITVPNSLQINVVAREEFLSRTPTSQTDREIQDSIRREGSSLPIIETTGITTPDELRRRLVEGLNPCIQAGGNFIAPTQPGSRTYVCRECPPGSETGVCTRCQSGQTGQPIINPTGVSGFSCRP